jgi:cytochrome P450
VRNAAIDFDSRDSSLLSDARRNELFVRLRESGELPIDTNGPFPIYSLVRHADIARAYADPTLYSPCAGLTLDTFDPVACQSPSKMLETAPTRRHRALRRSMQGAFRVSGAAEPAGADGDAAWGAGLRHVMQELVECFLDRTVNGEAMEFVTAFAAGAASATMSALLGVSRDRAAQLDPALRAIAAIDFQTTSRSVQYRKSVEVWLLKELTGVVRANRREQRSGGLIAALLAAEIEGEALSDHEAVLNCLNVVLAGTGATQHTLAGAVAVWSAHPWALDDVAAQPTLAQGLIEETLRWLTPVIHLTRVLTADTEILGQEVPRGAGVCLWNVSANRDEEVFEEAGTFEPSRAGNRHLAFGVGPQYCLGAQIVRMQLSVLLEGVLSHGVRFQLHGAPVWMRSNAIAGVESLPLRVCRGALARFGVELGRS